MCHIRDLNGEVGLEKLFLKFKTVLPNSLPEEHMLIVAGNIFSHDRAGLSTTNLGYESFLKFNEKFRTIV